MGWNRPRWVVFVAMGGLVWLGGSLEPGPSVGPRVLSSSAEAVLPADPESPSESAASAGPNSRHRGREANAPYVSVASLEHSRHSTWWLDSGPPIEVRFGEHLVRATPARLDVRTLREVEAGDRLTLALPEVGGLDVVVQRVTSPAPNVRQLQGHLADPVESYAVTLTVGPALAFANVTTPTGTWIAEFKDGNGWILRDDLTNRLVDHSVSDTRIPPGRPEAG